MSRDGLASPRRFESRLSAKPQLDRDPEARGGRVLDASYHPDRVFLEDRLEGYDGLDPLGLDVLEPADVVDEGRIVGIEIERVEREVAPVGILVDSAELVADGPVGDGPESRDLEDLRPGVDVDEAETPSDDPGGAKHALYPRGLGVRDDVEVFGLASQKKVADRSADNVGLVAVLPKALHYAERVGVDSRALDLVFRPGVHDGLRQELAVLGSAIADEQC